MTTDKEPTTPASSAPAAQPCVLLPGAEAGAQAFSGLEELAAYPLDATSDSRRYGEWLRERGEQTSRPAASGPAAQLPRRRSLGRRPIVPRHLGRRPSGPRRLVRTGARAGDSPMFSVVVPCYRPARPVLERCVESVLAQDFGDWELSICDDASGKGDVDTQLREIARRDSRISVCRRSTNGGIAAATNDAVAHAKGRFVVFLDQDDELHESALSLLAAAVTANPDAVLLYSDEDKIDEAGHRHMPSFKPDWSPDLLLSNAYMCHVLVVERATFDDLGGLRPEFDGAQDYDLMLRVTERLHGTPERIVHVPEVLYHWRVIPGSAAGDPGAKPWAFEAGRRALVDAAVRRGIEADVVSHPQVPGSYHFKRRPRDQHLVTAVIPFRDEPALLAACYRSFVEDPGHDDFELLLVDNDSALPETQAVLDELSRDRRVRVMTAPGPFDWVGINNSAATKARGDLLLFMNNDVEARSSGWLGAMVAHAERDEVGAVGARLLFPDGTIQHAGVAVGLCFGAVHLMQGASGASPGYLSLTAVARNATAVTGACMMSRRTVFEALDGFDASLPIAFNDIDYCLRLREAGYLVVYTPLAELVHHESKSRGHADDTMELAYLRRRWREAMLAGDPYYNPNLGRFDCHCRLPTEEDARHWETFLSMLDESSTS